MKSEGRPYRMAARALKAEHTGQQILKAATELFVELPYEALTLQAVAQRSGVTLQTVLRRFGSKEGLVAAAGRAGQAEVAAQRAEAPVGDVSGAVRNLFDHYEAWARVALRMLELEHRLPAVGTMARAGRAYHAKWVTRAFGPQLARLPAAQRRVRRAQLISLTDVFVWKLLRVDQSLSREKAEAAVVEMIDALCGQGER